VHRALVALQRVRIPQVERPLFCGETVQLGQQLAEIGDLRFLIRHGTHLF
jgi:hypothetical protein